MSEKYKVHDQDRPYFITFAVEEWVDTFTRQQYKDIVVDSLRLLSGEESSYTLRVVFDDKPYSPYCWQKR